MSFRDRTGGGGGPYKPSNKDQGPRVNEQIRVSQVRLISDEGEAFGVVDLMTARQLAREKGLDLVEVSPNASPPVVKLIDYGKFKYQQQKKANEAKKKAAQIQVKEIQMRPNIDDHDLEVKINHAKRFIADGDKIKVMMQFRGREMAYQKQGLEKFKTVIEKICEFGATVEDEPKIMGNRIISLLNPDKKKKNT